MKLLRIIFVSLFFVSCFGSGIFAFYEEDSIQERLYISGFVDMEYWQVDYKSDTNMLGPGIQFNENGQFVQNHLNLYFTFFIGEGWKAFSEIRYLYTPSRNRNIEKEDAAVPSYVTETPVDNSYLSTTLNVSKYGSIEIERVYIEWSSLPVVSFQFGRFFTPYGIWQQDHGAPAITTVRFPTMVLQTLGNSGIPKSTTGVHLEGNIDIASVLLDFSLYVGNGLSDADAIDDSNKNKAAGAFMNINPPSIAGIVNIDLGCSGYYGKRTLVYNKTWTIYGGIDPNPDMYDQLNPYNSLYLLFIEDPAKDKYKAKQFDRIAMAHIKISIDSLPLEGRFVLQCEGFYQLSKHDNDKRIVNSVHGYPVWEDKSTYSSYYAQAEYQVGVFPSLLITPYFRYERNEYDTNIAQNIILSKISQINIIGINLRPLPKVCVKGECIIVGVHSPYNTKTPIPISSVIAGATIPIPPKINNDFVAWAISLSVAF